MDKLLSIIKKYSISEIDAHTLCESIRISTSPLSQSSIKTLLSHKIFEPEIEIAANEILSFLQTEKLSQENNPIRSCPEKCQLCDKTCIFPNTKHQELILAKNPDQLKINTNNSKQELINYHICGNKHNCSEACSNTGICQIKTHDYKSDHTDLPPDPSHPVGIKLPCNEIIPEYKTVHKSDHLCNNFTFHRCATKCPECLSFCSKEANHSGFHSTDHLPKISDFFLNPLNLVLQAQNKSVKQTETNHNLETCSTFCSKLGRGHFHLKDCKDETECANQSENGIQHSKKNFSELPLKNLDEQLCDSYWAQYNFEVPVPKNIKEKISKCTHVCALPECQAKASYCIWKNWHVGEHVFMCSHDTVYFTNIDIAFICDATGSMSSYIEASKKTVKRIMTVFKNMMDDESRIKFAFIAYRDHPPQDSTYVTNVHDFANEEDTLKFIETITAGGGGDTPEAVLDGINDAAFNINWRDDGMKFVFHVLDAPGHGKDWCNTDDGFPDGCPCKLDIQVIGDRLNQLKVRYKCIKIGTQLELTMLKLKGAIKNFEVSELDKASQMEIVVTEIMTRDMTTC